MINVSYKIPQNSISNEEVIKRSRFIAHIAHTPDVDAAKSFISSIKAEYADAGHNCWAYVAGAPDDSQILGFSDDGEPNGTAGKPMLNVLMGAGIGEITAVVTRYFGGIKLGTGGLARAYGGAVNKALEELPVSEKIPEVIVTGISEYAHQATIEQILKSFNVLALDKEFTADVGWQLKMDAREAPLAISEITDKTSGRVNFEIQED